MDGKRVSEVIMLIKIKENLLSKSIPYYCVCVVKNRLLLLWK